MVHLSSHSKTLIFLKFLNDEQKNRWDAISCFCFVLKKFCNFSNRQNIFLFADKTTCCLLLAFKPSFWAAFARHFLLHLSLVNHHRCLLGLWRLLFHINVNHQLRVHCAQFGGGGRGWCTCSRARCRQGQWRSLCVSSPESTTAGMRWVSRARSSCGGLLCCLWTASSTSLGKEDLSFVDQWPIISHWNELFAVGLFRTEEVPEWHNEKEKEDQHAETTKDDDEKQQKFHCCKRQVCATEDFDDSLFYFAKTCSKIVLDKCKKEPEFYFPVLL